MVACLLIAAASGYAAELELKPGKWSFHTTYQVVYPNSREQPTVDTQVHCHSAHSLNEAGRNPIDAFVQQHQKAQCQVTTKPVRNGVRIESLCPPVTGGINVKNRGVLVQQATATTLSVNVSNETVLPVIDKRYRKMELIIEGRYLGACT